MPSVHTVYRQNPMESHPDMMVEYAKLMKEWDNIGVWKTDVLNNTASSNRDDYRIGRVAAEQHHTQTWTDLCSATPSNTIYQCSFRVLACCGNCHCTVCDGKCYHVSGLFSEVEET